MAIEIGNAYSFSLDNKISGGLFITDIYKEFRGGINISVAFVDFRFDKKPIMIDFIDSFTLELKKKVISKENIEIKSFNIWKRVFLDINGIKYVGKLELKEFESIATPISTINPENHIKNEFLKFYTECSKIKEGKVGEYQTISIVKLTKT